MMSISSQAHQQRILTPLIRQFSKRAASRGSQALVPTLPSSSARRAISCSPSVYGRGAQVLSIRSTSRSRSRSRTLSSGAASLDTSPSLSLSLTPTESTSTSRQDSTTSSSPYECTAAYSPFAPEPPYATLGPTTKQNLFTSINSALRTALATDPTAILFGEDIAFGGVFRCSQNLLQQFGKHRVFNTPLSENGIAGMAIGYASAGGTAIGEIQFADYIFPAMDQLVNEMAKFRYRSGRQWGCGGVTLRAPCGAVGHGGLYHSQSPEAYLAHTPGLVVVMPRGPRCAKGLLLSSIRCKDPVIFLEPKILYRSAVEEVPDADYEIPLGKAEILRPGTDVTLLGWGAQLRTLQTACDLAQSRYGISCELIDLRTLLPWDSHTVIESVKRTGKLIVSHEAPVTCGFGAEVVATLQEECFFHLEAPIRRVCGYDMPFNLVFEKYYLPDEKKNLDAILGVMEMAK